MDTIEFRSMSSDIQAVPAAQESCGCQGGARPVDENGHVYFDSCEDAKAVDMGEKYLDGGGRMLDVTMTLKNVCPSRRIAVGVALTEMDEVGAEHPRGFKAMTVPAHYQSSCCDVAMPAMRFILPEDLRLDGNGSICQGSRHFVVRATAHYVDTCASMR